MPRLAAYAVKVLWQSLFLLLTLCKTRKSSHLLLQNPPAIPTLFIAWLFCLFRCTRLLIDWHNYGYSILALATSSNHPLVIFSQWYEKWFGQLAFWSFCVTEAMKKDLNNNWDISRTDVLYDRPADHFKSLSDKEKHHTYLKLSKDIQQFKSIDSASSAFAEMSEEGVKFLPSRPAILISSTSWTEDEDFSILLSALDVYDSKAKADGSKLPALVCVITGKGPQKEKYLAEISERSWSKVSVTTPWLQAEDYPKLLGAADLGVCLHYSSSGLDLPMKVVDMFGTGLPVCAINFKCLSELVKHDENGLIFSTSTELATQIMELLEDFPTNQERLNTFRQNLKSFQDLTWENHWEDIVLPVMSK